MKTLHFKRDSWHYFIAKKFGDLNTWDDNMDLCTYLQSVFLGCVVFLVGGAVSLATTVCFGDWLGWIAAMITNWQYINPAGPAMFITVAMMGISIVGFMIWAAVTQSNRRDKRNHKVMMAIRNGEYVEPEPNFLKMAYISIKEKTCFKIELH